MSSHVHIGLYDALREAGASDETARAGAVDIPVGQNLATKEDLLQAIAGVNDRIAKVTTDVASLRGGLRPRTILCRHSSPREHRLPVEPSLSPTPRQESTPAGLLGQRSTEPLVLLVESGASGQTTGGVPIKSAGQT